jgi:hypothetical protein
MNAARKLLEGVLIAIEDYAWIIFPGNNILLVLKSK